MADQALTRQNESGKTRLDANYFSECFDYCPDTGNLYWKERPLHHFADERNMKAVNTRRAGTQAFTSLDDKGYAAARVNNKLHRAHRIIAVMVLGQEDGWIDHINGVRSDNRLCNLRIVNAKQNAQNQRRPKNNTTGIIGVSYIKARNRWVAHIGGSELGKFQCIGEAIKVRRSAEARLGYHKNHGLSV